MVHRNCYRPVSYTHLHGIEERGIYRIHQFEKQEMIVVCKPEDSMTWYDKLWHNSVELFRSMAVSYTHLDEFLPAGSRAECHVPHHQGV